MTSRERVEKALRHQQPDRVPIDLGASGQTGINASVLYELRRELGLKERPIDICEPFQLLGNVDEDLRKALGVDTVPLWCPVTLFGTRFGSWKDWKMPDGTPVNMPGDFQYDETADGGYVVYPQGDRTVPPSVRLPENGTFFDNIDRAPSIDESDMNPIRDFQNLYGVFCDEDALFLEKSCGELYKQTDCAIHFNFNGGGFGDAAIIPGPYEKHPRGIRRLEEWYMAHYLYPEYLKELFAWQTELALTNLEIIKQAVGDRITTINISCTDFGSQSGELMSVDHFREFYKGHYIKLNEWVHENTGWFSHFHCCGSIANFLPEFVESGFDVFNPVQLSAANMNGPEMKAKYGDKLTFWGGGVDTQKTLPFGTPDEVRAEVRERLDVFSPGGGFVFNTIHNIVGGTPVENVIAMFDEVKSFNDNK
ncbi:MAG: methyltransferase [Spirochaetales bacterium]|nr:methyltransferase [Spirochaetales bacterium]